MILMSNGICRGGSTSTGNGLIGLKAAYYLWDANIYLGISQYGYPREKGELDGRQHDPRKGGQSNFFPLWPGLIRLAMPPAHQPP